MTTKYIDWIYAPPPNNATKIIMLTRFGVATIGIWGDGHDVIGYIPLPKRNKKLEEELGLAWPTPQMKQQ